MPTETELLTMRITQLENKLAALELSLDTEYDRNGWMDDHLEEAPQKIFAQLVQYLDNILLDFNSADFEKYVGEYMLSSYEKMERNTVTDWLNIRAREIMALMLPTYKLVPLPPVPEPPLPKE